MKYLILLFCAFAILGIGYLIYYYISQDEHKFVNPLAEQTAKIVEKPLEKYQIDKLREVEFSQRPLRLGEIVSEDEDIVSRIFYFTDVGATGDEEGYEVSGLMNYPKEKGEYPVIVMFRGFVDREVYTTGEGTRRSGEELARRGFITLAPDFLGYGDSEMPSQEPLEERFQTYTTALSLVASLDNLNVTLSTDEIEARADVDKRGFFAHSNGGQIALTTLGVLGADYPTVLWAPVTKPFPYNILYFTDEYDDEGKALRKIIADFEKDYDVFEYSIPRRLELVKAPLQVHQGQDDEAVPQRWSDEFYELVTENEIEIDYHVYPLENHNFNNGSWQVAIDRSIDFFRSGLSMDKDPE